MAKPAFDADALITMFENASATGSARLRQSVADATLQALRGRELSLKNIRAVLGTVTQAASSGLAKNTSAGLDVDAMLDQAVAGMDDALLKAVDANRMALEQLAAQGADLREKHLKKALADLEKMEDTLIETVQKSAGTGAAGAGGPMAAAWGAVLEKLNAGGTLSGAQASRTAEQFSQQVKDMQGAMRETRAAGLRAASALAESYTAMVSGVLIGMADAMRAPAAAPAEKPARAKK